MLKSEKYGERRGAAFGLAGVVKGFRISCLKKYGIVTVLRQSLTDRFFLDPLSMTCVFHSLKLALTQLNSCWPAVVTVWAGP